MGVWESGPQPLTGPCTALTPPAFDQIGGYEQLAAAYARAIPSKTVANTTCHLPRADAMHMFRDPYTGDLPWTGMTFGLTIMATWYWCTDQVRVNIITCYLLAFRGGLWRVRWPSANLWCGPGNTCMVGLGLGAGCGPPC